MEFILFIIVFYFPVWLPMIVAAVARNSPPAIRGILLASGLGSGTYALGMVNHLGPAGGCGGARPGMFYLPFSTAGLSFLIAYTGVCALNAHGYIAEGRVKSGPGIVSLGLLALCVACDIFVAIPLLLWPTFNS